MALDLFRAESGFQIGDSVQILEGSGAPSLDAPVGSVYSDTSTGAVGYYLKVASGTGTDKWLRIATQDYVQQFGASSISWREPAILRVTGASLPATTVDVLDGHTIVAGDRVLFSDISGGNGPNIYEASGGTGAWTWTEVSNLETSGDTVYITGGTDGGKTFTYDGTNWIWISQESSDELGYLRAFVGKNAAGNETPSYSSTNQIANGQSLETAIGNLDGAFGPDLGGTLYTVSAGQSAFGAIGALDGAIGADVTTGGTILAANTIQENIQALDSAIGADVTTEGAIVSTNTVNQNITAINDALTDITLVTTGTGPTPVVDTLDAGIKMAKWLIKIVDGTNVRAEEVFAIMEGTSSDFTRYGVLKIGANVTVTVAVTVAAGKLVLTVTAASGATVTVKRLSVA